MTARDELRYKVAYTLRHLIDNHEDFTDEEYLPDADAVLAIPEIADALRLAEELS